MNTQKQIFLIVLLNFVLVGACAAYTAIDLPVRAPDQEEWTMDESIERGALLYANNCRTCHGNKGEGFVGPALNTPELQDQEPLTLAANRHMLRRTLYCGRAGTLMPAWLNTNGGALNNIQIENIINFLTAPGEGDEEPWGWEETGHFAEHLNHELSAIISGDTLDSIAAAHGIGPKELAAANGNPPLDEFLPKGTKLQIPGFGADPNGYIYNVYNSNETITKIAQAQHVGAIILADLNGIPYEFSEKKGVASFSLKTEDGADIPGLFPGDVIELPEGATYRVLAGDTLTSIAEQHGVSVGDLRNLNEALIFDAGDDDELAFQLPLELPQPVVLVGEGDTLDSIARAHGIEEADLAAANELAAGDPIEAGSELALPEGTRYIVQPGDTWELVAAAHRTTPGDLAGANDLDAGTPLSADVIFELPKIDEYTVEGQSLADVAEGFGNVTAASLARANDIDENSVLAIGYNLVLPEDAYGGAPPDAINQGTACVQYAVADGVLEGILGTNFVPEEPEEFTTELVVIANSNDWTFETDGSASAPNEGVAKIAAGTAVRFVAAVGLHNIVFNGEVQEDPFQQPAEVTITFDEPGEYDITCDYHPAMYGKVWVE